MARSFPFPAKRFRALLDQLRQNADGNFVSPDGGDVQPDGTGDAVKLRRRGEFLP